MVGRLCMCVCCVDRMKILISQRSIKNVFIYLFIYYLAVVTDDMHVGVISFFFLYLFLVSMYSIVSVTIMRVTVIHVFCCICIC